MVSYRITHETGDSRGRVVIGHAGTIGGGLEVALAHLTRSVEQERADVLAVLDQERHWPDEDRRRIGAVIREETTILATWLNESGSIAETMRDPADTNDAEYGNDSAVWTWTEGGGCYVVEAC